MPLVLQVQAYAHGAWRGATSACVGLSRASTAAGRVAASKFVLNVPYRIRADYIRDPSDISNISTPGAWGYILVER